MPRGKSTHSTTTPTRGTRTKRRYTRRQVVQGRSLTVEALLAATYAAGFQAGTALARGRTTR
jgi:hypothetical protein